MNEEKKKCCVLIPAYREAGRIGDVVRRVRVHVPDILVVDDGSGDGTAAEARAAGAVVLEHDQNKGKGAALTTGFKHVVQEGFDCVVTMDGDGQHAPDDVLRFTEEHARVGTPVLVGDRMGHASGMPLVRRLTNRFMSWLLSREMKQRVPDTQCGFRLYRCDIIPLVMTETERYDAESEMLLRVADLGYTIGAVPVRVIYGCGVSSIHPVKDTVRFFRMLNRYRKKRKDVSDANA